MAAKITKTGKRKGIVGSAVVDILQPLCVFYLIHDTCD